MTYLLKYYITPIIFYIIACLPISASQQSSTIKNVWIEDNVRNDGKDCLKIHTHFNVYGLEGESIRCMAMFFDQNKQYINSNYTGYRTKSGEACTFDKATSTYESSVWKDFPLYMPYEALNLSAGKHLCYAVIYVCDSDYDMLAKSDYIPFYAYGSSVNRTTLENGGYMESTENADGSKTTVIHQKCAQCYGSGSCRLCKGAGGMWGGYGQYARYVICTSCGGAGKCKYCMGSGESVFTSTYYPSTNTTVGKDFWSGNTYVSGDGYSNSNSASGSNRTSSSSKCSICGGTGVDPIPWEDPAYNAGSGLKWCYTHKSNGKCKYCGKFGWHQHARCPKCNP